MATKLDIKREVEWRKCELDPLHFLTTYWHVDTVGKGYAQMVPFDYQIEDLQLMLDAHNAGEAVREIRLKARQLGWTTLAYGFAFWSAWFHSSHPWLGVSTSEDEAKDTLSTKLKQPYSYLPDWMRKRGPKLLSETQEAIEFDNGSRIVVVPSTSRAGRGKAMFGVLIDEAAFMEDPDGVFAALDPLCYGPLFMFSTANGMGNFFHETWIDAQKADSEWRSGFRPWSARPDRDEQWYERKKRVYRTKEHLFYQEYPSNPEEAFLKSGRTALNLEQLRGKESWCDPEARYDLSVMMPLIKRNVDVEQILREAEIVDGDERVLELHVWQHPYVDRGPDGRLARQPNFVIAVDVAEGLEYGDYSAIAVVDANYSEVVATVKAHIPVEDLGFYVEWLGFWYYTALVGVERNNMGLVPLTYLKQQRYPRLYRMEPLAQQGGARRTTRFGWHTNKSTKPKMVVDFNKAVADDVLLLHDRRFLEESFTFLADGKGGFNANPPNHDDLVDAHLIGWQLCLSVGEYPVVWVDPTPGPLTFDEVFEVMSPDLRKGNSGAGTALAGGIGQPERADQTVKSFEMVVQQ